MAKRNSHSRRKGHRIHHCESCKKPQQWYAQKENLDKHMRVFHRGGKTIEEYEQDVN